MAVAMVTAGGGMWCTSCVCCVLIKGWGSPHETNKKQAQGRRSSGAVGKMESNQVKCGNCQPGSQPASLASVCALALVHGCSVCVSVCVAVVCVCE